MGNIFVSLRVSATFKLKVYSDLDLCLLKHGG